jgi:hypothetical protein
MPMVAIARPSRVASVLRTKEAEDRAETVVIPRSAKANISAGPKLSAMLARSGDRNISAKADIMPPKADPMIEARSARRARPARDSAKPSMVVAAAAAVPGMLRQMAVIEPA